MLAKELGITKSRPKTVVDYEGSVPVARRVVRIPRLPYLIHRFLMSSMDAVIVVYGIALLSIGWALKQAGLVFLPPRTSKRKDEG